MENQTRKLERCEVHIVTCSVVPQSFQSCKMSNLLHGQKSKNQILPQEKCVNCDIFSTSNQLQTQTFNRVIVMNSCG